MRPWVGFLVLAGCSINPAFDAGVGPTSASAGEASSGEDSGHGAGGVEPTSVGATGDAGTGTAGGSTTSPVSGPGETGTDGTGDGATSGSSEGTGETTIDAVCPAPCGECEACEGGTCVPVMGLSCTLPIGTPCQERLWGLDLGTGECRGYQSELPTCVAPGVCDYVCGDPGAILVDCHEACVRADHNCVANEPTAQVTTASVCVVTYTQTPGCGSTCVYDQNLADQSVKLCNAAGDCQETLKVDCGYAKCDDMAGCSFNCDNNDDCVEPAHCMFSQCVP